SLAAIQMSISLRSSASPRPSDPASQTARTRSSASSWWVIDNRSCSRSARLAGSETMHPPVAGVFLRPLLAEGRAARFVAVVDVQLRVPAFDRPVAEVDDGVRDIPAPVGVLRDRVVDAERHLGLDRAKGDVDHVLRAEPHGAEDRVVLPRLQVTA